MTQAWVTFLPMLQNKNRFVWFTGVEHPFCYSCLWAGLNMASSGWQNRAHLPFLRALSLVIQPIDSKPNNLNLKERACELDMPIIVFFIFHHCPPPLSSYWSPKANEDIGKSHVHSTAATCKNLPSNTDRQRIQKYAVNKAAAHELINTVILPVLK